jgi:hypothetical protein
MSQLNCAQPCLELFVKAMILTVIKNIIYSSDALVISIANFIEANYTDSDKKSSSRVRTSQYNTTNFTARVLI